MNKAIFLDRDDTLNYDSGHLGDPNLVKLYPYVPEVLFELREILGYKLIVISNQAGITKGLILEEDVIAVNNKINELLAENKTRIDDFFYCPYHPDFDSPEKAKCRKPSPLMIHNAIKKYNIDKAKSYLIGDRITDIQAGNNVPVKTIFVEHSIYKMPSQEIEECRIKANYTANNFNSALEIIKNNK